MGLPKWRAPILQQKAPSPSSTESHRRGIQPESLPVAESGHSKALIPSPSGHEGEATLFLPPRPSPPLPSRPHLDVAAPPSSLSSHWFGDPFPCSPIPLVAPLPDCPPIPGPNTAVSTAQSTAFTGPSFPDPLTAANSLLQNRLKKPLHSTPPSILSPPFILHPSAPTSCQLPPPTTSPSHPLLYITT